MQDDNAGGEQSGSSDASSGDHPSDNTNFTPPADGSWVPRGRLDDVLGRVHALNEKVTALETKKLKEKSYSRQELAASVEAGEIDQPSADAIWDRQQETHIDEQIAAGITVQSQQTARRGAISEYEVANPEIVKEGSPANVKVFGEYAHYVNNLGMADNDTTLLAVLRGLYGPVEQMQTTKPAQHDTHMETGGAGGDSGGQKLDKGKELTVRERAFYENGIRVGAYKDWDAVWKERSWKREAA